MSKKLLLITAAWMICRIITGKWAMAEIKEPDASAFKVSFIPKPWEINVERHYVPLTKGWRFIKGKASHTKKSPMLGVPAYPKEYVLRNV